MGPLSKFQQLRKIGEGGMGVVYQGWDSAIGRDVAIKFVRLSGEGISKEREEFVQRLRREGQAAGNLSHPNVVTIYDFVQQPELAYIVMEYVEGQSLESWLPDCEALGPHVVLDIIRQSATALDYAHNKGVVHRDVKPSNILLRSDGVVKLADFGLAKVTASSKLTQTGSAIGTPHYMSPEQIDSDVVDARSDQYSLAVCTYEMITGARPFTGSSLHNLFHKILNTAPPTPMELNATLSKEIGQVLERALSKKPEQRFLNCLEFVTALERACAMTPSWRPKSAPAQVKASLGGSGAGGSNVAVATPMPSSKELNQLVGNLDPWLTEAMRPRSDSLPPTQPTSAPPSGSTPLGPGSGDLPRATQPVLQAQPIPMQTPMPSPVVVAPTQPSSKKYLAIGVLVAAAVSAAVWAGLTFLVPKPQTPVVQPPARIDTAPKPLPAPGGGSAAKQQKGTPQKVAPKSTGAKKRPAAGEEDAKKKRPETELGDPDVISPPKVPTVKK
jgi:serine/threonine protein kinase